MEQKLMTLLTFTYALLKTSFSYLKIFIFLLYLSYSLKEIYLQFRTNNLNFQIKFREAQKIAETLIIFKK